MVIFLNKEIAHGKIKSSYVDNNVKKKVYMRKKEKNSKLKRGLQITWLVYAIFSIMIIVLKLDALICKEYAEISKHISLDEHWNITINDRVYEDVSLGGFTFPSVEKGDTITMQRQLPKDWDMVEATLRLYIRHTAVKMYVKNEQVYEYGCERLKKNKSVGSGLQFINFPDKYKGQQLKLVLYVTEDYAFSKFDPVRIYEWKHAYRAFLTENRLPMFLGSFLVIFGISVLVITIIALLFSRKYVRMLCLAAFSICMGLWTLCYYNVVLIYAIPLYSVAFVEYMALYLAPIPIIIYMYQYVEALKKKPFRVTYWILFVAQFIFDVVTLYLHTIDKVHCVATLKYMQILVVVHLIYFTVVVIKNIRFGHFNNRGYLVGLLIVVGCIGYDLLSYYTNRYHDGSMNIKGASSVGVMLFLFLLFLEFYRSMSLKIMEETERNFLIKSAYTDELTQLPNRRYCSEQMKKIDEDRISNYTIMSFDLNNLKHINDNYGHSQGDILIREAADVIFESFSEHGVVGRMGGDEFIAILKTSTKEEIEQLLKDFYGNIEKKNQGKGNMNVAISCGYAMSGELPERDTEKLYQMADDRMYKNKKKYKEARNH